MIDLNLKPWLIEINTNPCLELSSPLLGRLIPSLVENVFKYLYNHVESALTLSSLPLNSGKTIKNSASETILSWIIGSSWSSTRASMVNKLKPYTGVTLRQTRTWAKSNKTLKYTKTTAFNNGRVNWAKGKSKRTDYFSKSFFSLFKLLIIPYSSNHINTQYNTVK